MKLFIPKHYDRAYGCVLLATLLMALWHISITAAQSGQWINLTGKVDDAYSGRPLEGAAVIVSGWMPDEGGYTNYYETELLTDVTGRYSINLRRGYYFLMAVADDPETPGLDYIPRLYQLDAAEFDPTALDIDFHLLQGASIRIYGATDYVELGKSPEDLRFVVVDARNGTSYSKAEDRRIYAAIDIEPGLVLIPADVPFLICGISPSVRFTVDNNGSPFAFPQGSLETVDISDFVMNRNARVVSGLLNSTWSLTGEFGLSGIDMKTEVDDLNTAFGYLGLATLALRERDYAQCFVNLRAAYIIAQDVGATLDNTLSDVLESTMPLSFLMVLSAFGLAGVFVEKDRTRAGSGLAISLLFIAFLYYVAPGWRFADPLRLLAFSALAASLAIGLVTLFPRMGRDIVTPSGIALMSSLTSAFSLAARNLKRRRLRSSLILASIFTLVFGFTAFTSFQINAVVIAKEMMPPYPNAEPPEGLMIKAQLGPIPGLSPLMVEALSADPLVSSVAPKVETSPQTPFDPPFRAQLVSEGGHVMTALGAIGVSSAEAIMGHLDAAVIKGAFAIGGENTSLRAILISANAAEQLHVVPGDKVRFIIGPLVQNYTVAGILDDQILEGIIDLDAQPIRPYVFLGKGIAYLSPEQMVVFDWRELMRLGVGRLTRINVQTRSDDEVMQLSYGIARKWRYLVYATVGGEVTILHYSKDPVLLGSSTIPMVLVLVGLNLSACMLNAVYERRKEIVTLSLVGLNPSHISYIFLAEAVLVAFIGGAAGYLFGIGVPRALLKLGGPGFLTEKTSWIWSVVGILISLAAAVSASAIPARKASAIATPQIPRKWKLEYLAERDIRRFYIHIPQVVSEPELGRFIAFVGERFTETQFLNERMELGKMVDESDEGADVLRLLYTYSFAQEGSRSFTTENELVMSRRKGSSTYSMDLVIRIGIIYNYNPTDVVWRTASAMRRLMLQWTTAPSSERWGAR